MSGAGRKRKPRAEWSPRYAAQRANIRARRERLKLAGLCVVCGAQAATRGQLCEGCYARQQAATLASRIKRVSNGQCAYCAEVRATGNATYCVKHAQRAAKLRAVREIRVRAEGRCMICGKPRGDDGTSRLCRKCAERANARTHSRRNKLIASGRCPICGKPHDASSRNKCARCAARSAAAQLRRINRLVCEGKCQQCGAVRGTDGTTRYCRACAKDHSRVELDRQRRAIVEGRCIRCGDGRGLDGTSNRCRACAEAYNRRVMQRYYERTGR